jgi:hypothetical protein
MRKQNTRVVWGQEARKFATRRKLTSHKQWSRNGRLDMATGTRWCGQIVANRVGKETSRGGTNQYFSIIGMLGTVPD